MLFIPSFLHCSIVIYSLVPNSEVSWTGRVSASSSQELKGNILYGRGAVKDWFSEVLNNFAHDFDAVAERLNDADPFNAITDAVANIFLDMIASIAW